MTKYGINFLQYKKENGEWNIEKMNQQIKKDISIILLFAVFVVYEIKSATYKRGSTQW